MKRLKWIFVLIGLAVIMVGCRFTEDYHYYTTDDIYSYPISRIAAVSTSHNWLLTPTVPAGPASPGKVLTIFSTTSTYCVSTALPPGYITSIASAPGSLTNSFWILNSNGNAHLYNPGIGYYDSMTIARINTDSHLYEDIALDQYGNMFVYVLIGDTMGAIIRKDAATGIWTYKTGTPNGSGLPKLGILTVDPITDEVIIANGNSRDNLYIYNNDLTPSRELNLGRAYIQLHDIVSIGGSAIIGVGTLQGDSLLVILNTYSNRITDSIPIRSHALALDLNRDTRECYVWSVGWAEDPDSEDIKFLHKFRIES